MNMDMVIVKIFDISEYIFEYVEYLNTNIVQIYYVIDDVIFGV